MITNNSVVTYNSPYKQYHTTIDLIQLYLKYKEEMNEFARIKPNRWSIKSINSTTTSNVATTTTTSSSSTATKEYNNTFNYNNQSSIVNIKDNCFNTTPLLVHEPLNTTTNRVQKKRKDEEKDTLLLHNDVDCNTSLIIINSTPLEIKKEIDEKVAKENSKFKRKRGRPKKNTLE